MKKKITALILVIPLILLFTAFSLASVAVLKVPIPVSGIQLLMNDVEYIDLSDGGTLTVSAKVLPENAKERGVTYRIEPVQGKPKADVIVDEKTAVATAQSVGSARVVVQTKDGGYKAAFLLEVSSKKAVGITFPSNEFCVLTGETKANIATVAPYTALNKSIIYRADDENIAKVDPISGAVTGLMQGTTRITATLKGGILLSNGSWQTGDISASYSATVSENTENDIVTGGENGSEIIRYAGGDTSDLIVGVKNSILEEAAHSGRLTRGNEIDKGAAFLNGVKVNNGGSCTAELLKEGVDKSYFKLNISFASGAEGVNVNIFTSTVSYKNEEHLDKVAFNISKKQFFVGESSIFQVATLPENISNKEVSFTFSDGAVAAVTEENGYYVLNAKTPGTTAITVTVRAYGITKTSTIDIMVFEKPLSFNFALNTKVWGIKEQFAFASHKYINNAEIKDTLTLELIANGKVDIDQYEFTCSDPSIATLAGNRLSVLKSGRVTVTAVLKNAEELGLSEEFTTYIVIDCVDGVNVSDYAALAYSSAKGRRTVLQSNIMVGEDLTGKSVEEKEKILERELFSIATTADWSYYKLQEKYTEPPKIKVAIEFKNDVFGNGFTLNAHNITSVKDSAGLPIKTGFAGPLDMVAVYAGFISASAKAQDNIVFLVRNDNIKIDNIELMSRNLAPNNEGTVELNDLNYAGTTLEIMGDNVSLVNSRVRNGRTNVRIFGGANPDQKINVRIESCILSYAREFILKIGTNKTLPSTEAELQPNLAVGGKTYGPRVDENFKDAKFVETFVKTEVTVKNTTFTKSGVFSIGIESKFGGTAFRGGGISFPTWAEASGTSYPALLHFEGEVGLYDWKNIKDIDSSTLIEIIDKSGAGGSPIDFNIGKILSLVAEKQPEYKKLLEEVDGQLYAHGGVAIYGGGKNYSALNLSKLDETSLLKEFAKVSVSLKILEGVQDVTGANYLIMAAGVEPFRFYMFDSQSKMGYMEQENLLKSGKAYDFVTPII